MPLSLQISARARALSGNQGWIVHPASVFLFLFTSICGKGLESASPFDISVFKKAFSDESSRNFDRKIRAGFKTFSGSQTFQPLTKKKLMIKECEHFHPTQKNRLITI